MASSSDKKITGSEKEKVSKKCYRKTCISILKGKLILRVFFLIQ